MLGVLFQRIKPFIYKVITVIYLEEVQPIITGEGAEVHDITITMFIFDGHGINLIEMMFRCECLGRGVAPLHKTCAGKPRGDSFIYSVRMKSPQGRDNER